MNSAGFQTRLSDSLIRAAIYYSGMPPLVIYLRYFLKKLFVYPVFRVYLVFKFLLILVWSPLLSSEEKNGC